MIKRGDRVVLKQSVSYGKNHYGEVRLSAEKGAFGTVMSCIYPGSVFVNFDNPEYNIGKTTDGGLFVCDYQLAVLFKQPDEFEMAIIRIKQGIRANVKKARLAASYNFHALQVDIYAKLRPGYVGRLDFRSKFGRSNND